MSVQILLAETAVRLDADRHEPSRAFVQSSRRGDLEALLPGAWIIDRPDHSFRYRAHVPLERVRKAFGPAAVAALESQTVPSPAGRRAERQIAATFAALRDGRPIPPRVPVLRSDLDGAWERRRLFSAPEPPELERARRLNVRLSETEVERFRLGTMPHDPHDKWHLYFEEPWLYAARRYVGSVVAKLELRERRLVRGTVPLLAPSTEPERYVSEILALTLQAVDLLVGRGASAPNNPATGWQIHGPAWGRGALEPGIAPSDLSDDGEGLRPTWWDGATPRIVS